MTEQQEHGFKKKDLVITEEMMERIRSLDAAQNSPEAKREERKARQLEKRDSKIVKEIFSKPFTKTRMRQLQKIFQHIEYYNGKHVRAQQAINWLKDDLEEYRYNQFIEKEENQLLQRIKYLKKMSFRSGDVYEDIPSLK